MFDDLWPFWRVVTIIFSGLGSLSALFLAFADPRYQNFWDHLKIGFSYIGLGVLCYQTQKALRLNYPPSEVSGLWLVVSILGLAAFFIPSVMIVVRKIKKSSYPELARQRRGQSPFSETSSED